MRLGFSLKSMDNVVPKTQSNALHRHAGKLAGSPWEIQEDENMFHRGKVMPNRC